jgi:hypothetical protein
VKTEDEIFFIRSDLTTFDRRTKIIHPTETTTFTTTKKTSTFGKSSPTTFTFFLNVF